MKKIKWLEGEKTIQDFKTQGNNLTKEEENKYTFQAESGIYTVYLKGNNGQETVEIVKTKIYLVKDGILVEGIDLLPMSGVPEGKRDMTTSYSGWNTSGANVLRIPLEDDYLAFSYMYIVANPGAYGDICFAEREIITFNVKISLHKGFSEGGVQSPAVLISNDNGFDYFKVEISALPNYTAGADVCVYANYGTTSLKELWLE
jgi:hypothetical protein